MITPADIQRWMPLGGGRCALEHGTSINDGIELALALRALKPLAADVAFVVVRLDEAHRLSGEQIASALGEFDLGSPTPHLCLAGTHEALSHLEPSAVDGETVGLLLDEVDEDCALSRFICRDIEAVRFTAAFVGRTLTNLRVDCALQSMLGLAQELGLCTLGDDTSSEWAFVSDRRRFDYVKTAIGPAGGGTGRWETARPDATVVDLRPHRQHHSMIARTAAGNATERSSR